MSAELLLSDAIIRREYLRTHFKPNMSEAEIDSLLAAYPRAQDFTTEERALCLDEFSTRRGWM